MLHAPARISLEGLFALARTGDANTILRAICLFATSREGYLVANGYALRGVDDDFPLVGPSTANGVARQVDEQSDIVLARIGLAMVRAEPEVQARPNVSRCAIAAVAARLGLLAQALDMAFHHLEGRQSFGQKTMHHQLVKTRFAHANALIVRLIEEIGLVEECGEPQGLERMQSAISEEFSEVSKLMGGHGYLISGINTLEYLSSLMASIYCRHGASAVLTYRDRTVHSVEPGDAP